MISARLAGTLLAVAGDHVVLAAAVRRRFGVPRSGPRPPPAAPRPAPCAPRAGTDLERAFAAAGCLAGDVVLAAPPGVRQATILAARVCDFGRAVVVERRDEAGDAGAVLACTYAGRVRPVPE
jgi:hypothetical protein